MGENYKFSVDMTRTQFIFLSINITYTLKAKNAVKVAEKKRKMYTCKRSSKNSFCRMKEGMNGVNENS